jgi:Flp pilus assembly protein TadB
VSAALVAVALVGAAVAAARASAYRSRQLSVARLAISSSDRGLPRSSIDAHALAAAIGAGAMGWVIGRALGLVAAVVAVVVARTLQSRRASSIPPVVRQERLADAIGAIAAAVRAGSSLPQAIGYAAGEAEVPVRVDLEHLMADLEVGVPLEAAVAAWAERVATADADLVAGALDLHRRSGGDLPAVLDQVTTTIRERVSIAREVRSLTAQARLSAWILGCLPIGFFGFLWLTARQDIQGALSTPVGVACVLVGLLRSLQPSPLPLPSRAWGWSRMAASRPWMTCGRIRHTRRLVRQAGERRAHDSTSWSRKRRSSSTCWPLGRPLGCRPSCRSGRRRGRCAAHWVMIFVS